MRLPSDTSVLLLGTTLSSRTNLACVTPSGSCSHGSVSRSVHLWTGHRPVATVSKRFVFEVAFALQRLRVFVLAQNIFVELHVRAAKIFEERFDALFTAHHVVRQIIYIDVH